MGASRAHCSEAVRVTPAGRWAGCLGRAASLLGKGAVGVAAGAWGPAGWEVHAHGDDHRAVPHRTGGAELFDALEEMNGRFNIDVFVSTATVCHHTLA